MAERADPHIGAVLQDTYIVERRIGRGGMGAVYEAAHTRLPRRFAVKILADRFASRPDALLRFQREAEVTSRLGHAHIVEVVDFHLTRGGTPYIVMELLEGEDLAQRLDRELYLSIGDTTRILEQLASALRAAHDGGVIHRDLKPENVFLCRRGGTSDLVKVLDFGISKVVGGDDKRITGSGQMIGTPLFMAPEQAESRTQDVDRRTDIYALGALVYYMLVGEPPFTDRPLLALLNAITQDPAPRAADGRPGLSDAVSDVVARSLSKHRDSRYATVGEFMRAFIEAATPSLGPESVAEWADDWEIPDTAVTHGAVTDAVTADTVEVATARAPVDPDASTADKSPATVIRRARSWSWPSPGWMLLGFMAGLAVLGTVAALSRADAPTPSPASPVVTKESPTKKPAAANAASRDDGSAARAEALTPRKVVARSTSGTPPAPPAPLRSAKRAPTHARQKTGTPPRVEDSPRLLVEDDWL